MAREQSKYYPQDATFRAEVVVLNEDGSERFKTSYGPYATPGTAKGVATQKTSWGRQHGYSYRITIQRAAMVWEDIEVIT